MFNLCCLVCVFTKLKDRYERVGGLFECGPCDCCGAWAYTLSRVRELDVLDRLSRV